jgi:hypothetical protein
MKLICYLQDRPLLDIRPATVQRDWMDRTRDRYAYRCLPLNIANAHGWELCCEETFEAAWNGRPGLDDIKIHTLDGATAPAISHFGSGVLTFHVACVFRTDPGWNLMAMGPPNRPKPGIQALTGVIETDWAPYGFTMNWIFTEPHRPIQFMKGEPFCFIFPVPRGVIDQVEPEFRDMRSDPALYAQYSAWTKSRSGFIADLKVPGSAAVQQKWQRGYHQGKRPDGTPGIGEHQTKLAPRPFKLVGQP